jgi:hypothetical protein
MNWINLLAVLEGHLQAETAIGLQGHDPITNAQAGGWIGGPIDDQFGIGNQPETALAGSQSSS